MFNVPFPVFAFVVLVLGIGGVFGLWAYYGTRDRRFQFRGRERHAFYCVKCGRVYTHRRGDRPQACPACGFKNDRLKF